MGSKSVLLLSLLAGGLITFFCYKDHKNSLSLKGGDIEQGISTQGSVAAATALTGAAGVAAVSGSVEANETMPVAIEKVVEEEVVEAPEVAPAEEDVAEVVETAPEHEEAAKAPEAAPVQEVIEKVKEPSFAYRVEEKTLNATLAQEDDNELFHSFADKYCAEGCSKAIVYLEDVKVAPWQEDALKVASFLKDNNIKNGAISVEDGKFNIEGEFDNAELKNELIGILEPINAQYPISDLTTLVEVAPEPTPVVATEPTAPEPVAEESISLSEAASVAQEKINEMLRVNPVYFEFNSDVITQESVKILDDVVSELENVPGLALEVQGHTDSAGKDAYNKALSQKRAEAVKSYLLNHNVNASEVVAVGYGEERPIDTENTRSKINRRVEIHLKEGGK